MKCPQWLLYIIAIVPLLLVNGSDFIPENNIEIDPTMFLDEAGAFMDPKEWGSDNNADLDPNVM